MHHGNEDYDTTYYAIQFRTIAESPHKHVKYRDPDERNTKLIKRIKEPDEFHWKAVPRNKFDSVPDLDRRSVRHECGYDDGYKSVGYARQALAKLRRDDAKGLHDAFNYGTWTCSSQYRHQYRIVRVRMTQTIEVQSSFENAIRRGI